MVASEGTKKAVSAMERPKKPVAGAYGILAAKSSAVCARGVGTQCMHWGFDSFCAVGENLDSTIQLITDCVMEFQIHGPFRQGYIRPSKVGKHFKSYMLQGGVANELEIFW